MNVWNQLPCSTRTQLNSWAGGRQSWALSTVWRVLHGVHSKRYALGCCFVIYCCGLVQPNFTTIRQNNFNRDLGNKYDPISAIGVHGQIHHIYPLTHLGRVTHICVSDLTSIGSDNGLSPGRRQAIIRTNAGILLIRPLGTNFSKFLVEILIFSFKKMRLKVSSAKRRPFCLGLNELKTII